MLIVDEFTSHVDRGVAREVARGVARFVRREGLSHVVFAACPADVEAWLRPCWCFNV